METLDFIFVDNNLKLLKYTVGRIHQQQQLLDINDTHHLLDDYDHRFLLVEFIDEEAKDEIDATHDQRGPLLIGYETKVCLVKLNSVFLFCL
jgi:hypothetical protein